MAMPYALYQTLDANILGCFTKTKTLDFRPFSRARGADSRIPADEWYVTQHTGFAAPDGDVVSR
jgi:hypothetical protein